MENLCKWCEDLEVDNKKYKDSGELKKSFKPYKKAERQKIELTNF